LALGSVRRFRQIVGSDDHSSLSETSFESKKHTYTNSDVKIAEEVAKYDEWDDEQIEERN
jgi:hypothetical protein